MLLLIVTAALSGQSPDLPMCESRVLRVARNPHGLIAKEELRVCDAGGGITVAHNQIFLSRKGEARQLVATIDSVGARGAPLSWVGSRLLIHTPKKVEVGFLKAATSYASVEIKRDESDKEFMQDNEHSEQ